MRLRLRTRSGRSGPSGSLCRRLRRSRRGGGGCGPRGRRARLRGGRLRLTDEDGRRRRHALLWLRRRRRRLRGTRCARHASSRRRSDRCTRTRKNLAWPRSLRERTGLSRHVADRRARRLRWARLPGNSRLGRRNGRLGGRSGRAGRWRGAKWRRCLRRRPRLRRGCMSERRPQRLHRPDCGSRLGGRGRRGRGRRLGRFRRLDRFGRLGMASQRRCDRRRPAQRRYDGCAKRCTEFMRRRGRRRRRSGRDLHSRGCRLFLGDFRKLRMLVMPEPGDGRVVA
jgi:hypothetical protein